MADDPKQLKNAFEALAKQIEALTEINKKLIENTVAANKKVADSQAKTNKNLEQEIANRRIVLNSQIAQTEEIKKQAEEANRYAEKQKLLNDYYSQTIENLQEEIRLRKENGEGVDELVKKLEEAKKGQKNLNDETKKGTKSIEKYGGILKNVLKGDLKSVLTGVGKEFAGKSKFIQKQMGNLESKLVQVGKSGGKALAALGASAVALTAALFITKEIIKLAISVENLSREIQKVTGLSKDFTNQIMANADAVRAFDPQMKMLGETTQALGKSFTDFSMLNKQVAADVTVTLTALTALGIGAGDLAKGMQLSTKALGQNADQAAQTQLELNALARDIGVAPAEMAANFAAAGPQLAKLGRDGVRAFKDLAIASKITGLEVSRLLAITEKFDTFEGAAEQAGKLNAALGGNFVNAMELMTATDPAERFGMIRDSVLDAGLAFDDMSYYQRKFYADAMGLSDVSELAAVMSGNMESLNGEIGKTAADYENAAKMAADFQSVQDQIKNALHALIPVVQPLAELIGDLASKISNFVTENKELLRSIGYGLLVALAAVGVALAVVAGKFIIIAGAVMAVVTAIGALINVMLHKRNSPTFFESLLETADRFDKLSGSTKKFAVETENTSTSVDQMRNSMSQATANRAGAQTIANSNVMSSAVDNAVNNTTNNYGQQGSQNIIVELDGKKVGEGVMGKFARSAAMV